MKDDPKSDAEFDLPEQTFSVLEISHLLMEKAWLIVVCMIMCLFIGLGYVSKQPKTYRSETAIEVDSEAPSVLKFDEDHPVDYTNQEALQTIVASFRSRSLLRRVVEKHGLQNDKLFVGTPGEISMDAAIDRLLAATSVETRKGTRLIDITAEYHDAQTAQKLANSLANEFIAQLIEQRALTSKIALNFLMGEAETLKAKLQASEEKLQEYKEQHNSVSLEEKQDTVVAKLKNQSGQVTEAKAARLRLEADYGEVQQHAKDVDALLAIASVADHPAVLECKQQITTLDAKISALTARYTEINPKLIQARAQMADAKASLAATVLKTPALLRLAYESAATTELNFETALGEQEKVALELNRQAIPYNVLYRDMETNRALYEAILRRLKEADIAKGIELTNVRIFEPATLPNEPQNPGKAKIAALCLACGSVLGVVLTFCFYALDSSLKTVDQAERVTGLPVIGAIPRGSRTILEKGNIFLISEPRSMIAEGFRSLRASLQLAAKRNDSRVFLFTSAISAEGKTFTSIHYAVALAQQGLRTLIIDADLRAPKVGRILLDDDHCPGLTDFIQSPAHETLAFSPTQIANLFALPAGSRVANPAELLSRPWFQAAVKKAAEQFDMVVIDSAPIHAVSDTLLLLDSADMVCLVAKAASTPARVVIRARNQLEQAGAAVAGLLLNQLPKRGGAGYYYYYSQGAYGSGSYGQEGRKCDNATAS
jgi:capsular exopolysaccharide synthesis family protein